LADAGQLRISADGNVGGNLRTQRQPGYDEVLAHIHSSHEQDAKVLISPAELAKLLQRDQSVKLVDVAFARGIRGGEHRRFSFAVAGRDARTHGERLEQQSNRRN